MTWERRERGGSYYTRSTKVNGRVEREYIGSGYLGQLAASLDLERRERRLAEMIALKRERAEMEDLERVMDLDKIPIETRIPGSAYCFRNPRFPHS